MKPMIWRPEPEDKKANQYLDQVNREPWLIGVTVVTFIIFVMTTLIIIGVF